jgi:hypothetical protein
LEREIGARLAPKTRVILKADSWQGSLWLLSLCIALFVLVYTSGAAERCFCCCCCRPAFFGRLAVLMCGLQTPADTPRENSRLQAHRHTSQTTLSPTPELLPSGLPTAGTAAAWVRHCAPSTPAVIQPISWCRRHRSSQTPQTVGVVATHVGSSTIPL